MHMVCCKKTLLRAIQYVESYIYKVAELMNRLSYKRSVIKGVNALNLRPASFSLVMNVLYMSNFR